MVSAAVAPAVVVKSANDNGELPQWELAVSLSVPVKNPGCYFVSAGAMYMNVKLPFPAAPSAAIAFQRTV